MNDRERRKLPIEKQNRAREMAAQMVADLRAKNEANEYALPDYDYDKAQLALTERFMGHMLIAQQMKTSAGG